VKDEELDETQNGERDEHEAVEHGGYPADHEGGLGADPRIAAPSVGRRRASDHAGGYEPDAGAGQRDRDATPESEPLAEHGDDRLGEIAAPPIAQDLGGDGQDEGPPPELPHDRQRGIERGELREHHVHAEREHDHHEDVRPPPDPRFGVIRSRVVGHRAHRAVLPAVGLAVQLRLAMTGAGRRYRRGAGGAAKSKASGRVS